MCARVCVCYSQGLKLCQMIKVAGLDLEKGIVGDISVTRDNDDTFREGCQNKKFVGIIEKKIWHLLFLAFRECKTMM